MTTPNRSSPDKVDHRRRIWPGVDFSGTPTWALTLAMALGVGAGVFVGATKGCSSAPEPPRIAERGYAGPAIGLAVGAPPQRFPGSPDIPGPHVVVIQAPSPGWEARLDQVRENFQRRDVFVTLTEPNPATMQPQVIVEQRVDSGVASSTPVSVYVRILKFGETRGEYVKAAESK
ncbi:MAG: hypothetical protein SFY95_12080 [Planctomycetota bacterium]|nr:hypothetical protein [Planctomycetota bacterium]